MTTISNEQDKIENYLFITLINKYKKMTAIDDIYTEYISRLSLDNVVLFVYTGEFDRSLWRVCYPSLQVETGKKDSILYTSGKYTVSFLDAETNRDTVKDIVEISNLSVIRYPEALTDKVDGEIFRGHLVVKRDNPTVPITQTLPVDLPELSLELSSLRLTPKTSPQPYSNIKTYPDNVKSWCTPRFENELLCKTIQNTMGEHILLMDAYAGIGCDSINFSRFFNAVVALEPDGKYYDVLTENIMAVKEQWDFELHAENEKFSLELVNKYNPAVIYFNGYDPRVEKLDLTRILSSLVGKHRVVFIRLPPETKLDLSSYGAVKTEPLGDSVLYSVFVKDNRPTTETTSSLAVRGDQQPYFPPVTAKYPVALQTTPDYQSRCNTFSDNLQMVNAILSYCDRREIFMDAFAGFGCDTFAFLHRFSSVVAVEANTKEYRMLHHNIRALSQDRIQSENSDFSRDYKRLLNLYKPYGLYLNLVHNKVDVDSVLREYIPQILVIKSASESSVVYGTLLQRLQIGGVYVSIFRPDRPVENRVEDCKYTNLYFPPLPAGECKRLQSTTVSLYSSTPHKYAVKIVDEIVRHTGTDGTIVDATCCIGADTVAFAQRFRHVVGFELDPQNYKSLVNNVGVYSLKNVELYNIDFLASWDIIRDKNPVAVYIDPPWGGSDYRDKAEVHLSMSGRDIVDVLIDMFTGVLVENLLAVKIIALKLPLNYSKADIARLTEEIGYTETVTFPKFQLLKIFPGDNRSTPTEIATSQSSLITDSHPYYTQTVKYTPYKTGDLNRDIMEFPHFPYAEPGNRQEQLIVGLPAPVEYRSLHWGQRKLLLTEIDFLTRVKADSEVVVYAGAADGRHIPLLLNMFPRLTFHLYDPRAFNDRLYRFTDRIFINPYYKSNPSSTENGFFTDAVARWYADQKLTTLFVSDIRTDPIESEILRNQEQQRAWITIMRPKWSMFKFKMPYPAVGKELFYEYLDGEIVKQCWAPIRSAETRLIIPATLRDRKWNTVDYERQCSWYNSVLRQGDLGDVKLSDVGVNSESTVRGFWDGIVGDKNTVYGSDFVYELQILSRYIEFDKKFYNRNQYSLSGLVGVVNRELLNSNETFGSRLRKMIRLPYGGVASDRQFRFLQDRAPDSLLNLLYKSLRGRANPATIKYIYGMVTGASSDTLAYRIIRDNINGDAKVDNEGRGNARARDVVSILNSVGSPALKSYLDIGGGDGAITSTIATALRIDGKGVYCADVKSWFDSDRNQKYPINYTLLDGSGKLPFPDNRFGFVTAFQSLHHIHELSTTLSELSRVTVTGGFLLIREHDVWNDEIKTLVDVEHALYERGLQPEENTDFIKTYYADYKNRKQWTNLLSNVGFTYVALRYPIAKPENNPTNYYYALYVKN